MLLYCLLSARTLRDAITRSVQFYRMLEERWGRLDLYVQGSDAELRIDSRRIQRNPIAFIVDTTGMTVLHGVFGWLIAEPIPVTTILLDYAETLRMHCDPALLPCPLELGADRAAMRFPSEYLDYPVVRTLDDFERRAGLSILFDQPENLAHAGVAERARRIMFGCLRERHDLPTLDELSAELNCNRARLRRNLSKAGVSYNSIKDSCRRELALDLLRRSRLSVEDIAIRLGFCDSDAFRRTFRHWMSMSPLQYRGIKGP
jgi:AraC-like DNA-binding protein